MAYAVLTRDELAPYAAALAVLGLEAIAMPVTRTEPPADPTALSRALAEPAAAILVASPRAATALVAAGVPPEAEVWAVGPATARVLAAAGVAVRTPEHARDGATVARALLAAADRRKRRVIVPRAEDGRDEAIELLRAADAIVEPVVAYRTVAVAADDPAVARGRAVLAAGEAAICGVFAPSQVAALDAIVPLASIVTRWVAIGETTAAALRARGLAGVAVAEFPTPEGMANAARAVYPDSP